MKTCVLVALVYVILLAACSRAPSPSAIQTAIAQTQAALSTAAPPPGPARPDTIPLTVTPAITNTPLPLSLLIPKDFIIDTNPEDFVLWPNNLPSEGEYYLPGPGWEGQNKNDEVIAKWPPGKGQEYIQRTGRVTGYWVTYLRGNDKVATPAEFYCNVIQFRTVEGAQTFVKDYTMAARYPSQGWQTVATRMVFGDISNAEYRIETISVGFKKAFYYIEFSYFNMGVYVYAGDYEQNVNLTYVEDAAIEILDKIQAAPLVPASEASFNR
jgi:hypothetical protein